MTKIFYNSAHPIRRVIEKRRPNIDLQIITLDGRIEVCKAKDIKNNKNIHGFFTDKVDERKTSSYIRWREKYGLNYYDIVELEFDKKTKMDSLHIPVPKLIRVLTQKVGYKKAMNIVSSIPRSRKKFRDNKFFDSLCGGSFFKCWRTSSNKKNKINNYVKYKDETIINLCLEGKQNKLRYIFSIPEHKIEHKSCNKCRYFRK